MNLLLRAMICIATSRPIRWAASWNYRVETALIQQQVGWEPVEWADVRPWGPERRNAFGVIPTRHQPSTLNGTKSLRRSPE